MLCRRACSLGAGATSASPCLFCASAALAILSRTENSCLFQFDRHKGSDCRYVNLWMRHAFMCQVRVLSVTILGGGGMIKELKVDNRPLVSQCLTKLKLSGLVLAGKFLDLSSCRALKYLKISGRVPHSR
ncbi:hypothetical protein PR202_gb16681 [Eleusine coracana subsp. coracana]|uniref:Secreted protein n=1 Tax=Eleusine coracana subsp. coracana TaxID=191504 RepID=A0AAV5F120_ELECO|nr:hypothetical protein PR202_gb16681 [Eleusine coracana subsp. coracana]